MARQGTSYFRWLQGLLISSIFSTVYLLTPLYIISALIAICLQYPCKHAAYLYGAPLIISILTPSRQMLFLAKYMTSMVDYFDYEEVHEITNEECLKLANDGRKFILAFQPHGVISFCSFCSWINAPPELRCVQSAVASVLMKVPILKNVMGIYGLTDASSKNICKIFRTGQGVNGCVVLYVGGIAELFKTCKDEERLFLKNRKGFIKIALREGVDVIPVYLFGNTSVLSVLKTGILATLSRKMQVSVTYFWGKWFLPIPRDDKLLYVRGKPLGLPHIPEPTDSDVNHWHAKYVEEVSRLYNENREKLPTYKHKKLFID
mmetsp:Transcript_12749/g.23900  ORF Transcript_12749/g.23900 Transcript_12749/m.23900 type:complete len:319 (-) Transcript_12749:53-1009(-)|eukprot:CAMPEP_0176482104 /NCGR_PEP_ID=MMETSP0200_2-20121128/3195_1 /TAXON_ID=947934 /ORGANISM="Chaetoceros sp., Strain GSL56" /LENGTH=318 /DNA_ID=CAMNT_0017878393 /DNA_START=12 /DNA_END=968 /DNA_ORIENTATION=+